MRKRRRLEWSPLAMSDRNAIFDYIEADSPRSAIIVDERIRADIETLTRFPASGRIGRVDGTRELVIRQTPYVAAYRLAGNTVRILRILHGAQRWPDDVDEDPTG
ncbi:MAG TPA: type II toxin-antitoxin system RelE/ParE family toxin [Candidatus Solibacter sp.]|nr:type II toxin-antitoxin system RelE/ParE family toxin [Candidatus Solibacter sp.]